MATTYNPQNTFVDPPWLLSEDGDDLTESFFQDREKIVYDKLYYLKLKSDGFTNSIDYAKTQTGLDFASNTAPTYSVPYVLTGNKSLKVAAETMDHKLKEHNDKLNNLNTNLGGSVIGSAGPVYASVNFIQNGMSHHTCLETIDNALKLSNNAIAALITTSNGHTTTLDNMIDSIGEGVDEVAGFDFANDYVIADGEDLKTIVERFSSICDGHIREIYRLKTGAFNAWADLLTDRPSRASILFFDDADDGVNATYTTCEYNKYRVLAKGTAGQILFIEATLANTSNNIIMRMAKDPTSTITVEFNTHGSLNQFTTILPAEIENETPVQSGYTAGTSLVIKITFNTPGEIYEIFTALKNV